MILNLLVFFIFSIFSLFSIIGYGSLITNFNLKDRKIENFVNFFFGLIFLNVIGFVLYYLNLSNEYLNLVILFVGLIFLKNKLNKQIFLNYLLISILLFSGLLISKLHEDWSYHFSFIEQITNHKPIIGIGNSEDIHVVSTSFFSFIQKIFYLPYYEFRFVLTPVYLIYLNLIFILINLAMNSNKKIILIYLMLIVILVVKLSRLSEYGYDYLASYVLISIFIIYFVSKIEKYKVYNLYEIYFVLFIFAISIKVTSILFLPIFIYILISEKEKFKEIKFSNIILLVFIFSIVFVAENFFRSGCLLYFFEYTCFENNNISWSIDYQRIRDHSLHVELWAKGYYHQENISNKFDYLKNFNWLENWIKIHFFYKIIEFLIIPLFFLFLSIFAFRRLKLDKNSFYFFLAAVISFLLWFLTIPQLRFGSGIIIALFISLIFVTTDINSKMNIDRKKIIVFFICCFLVFNLKNINRIKNEFERNDGHKFTNFPFPPKNRLQSIILRDKSTKYLLISEKELKKTLWFYVVY